MLGKIAQYNSQTGFGQIVANGVRYFFNKKHLITGDVDKIDVNRAVNFAVGKGTKAVQISLINPSSGKTTRLDSIISE